MDKKSSNKSVRRTQSHTAITANKSAIDAETKAKEERKGTVEKTSDSCLLILNDGQANSLASTISSKSRPYSCDSPGRKAPPVNRASSASSSSHRSMTPTKYIQLQAVRRKPENDVQAISIVGSDVQFQRQFAESTAVESRRMTDANSTQQIAYRLPADSKQTTSEGSVNYNNKDESDDSDEDSSSDSEPIKAPNELILEFLDCVMKSDYTNAQKLCKMILMYEPNNADALNFQSVIEEKIALGETTVDDEDDDDDDDETDSETSNSNSSSEESTED